MGPPRTFGPWRNIRSPIRRVRGRGGLLSRRPLHPRRPFPICSRPSFPLSAADKGAGPYGRVSPVRPPPSGRCNPGSSGCRGRLNPDYSVALHMDEHLADAVAAPARCPDDTICYGHEYYCYQLKGTVQQKTSKGKHRRSFAAPDRKGEKYLDSNSCIPIIIPTDKGGFAL